MVKVVTNRREFFYVALLLGVAITSLSLEFSNPLGTFLGVLLVLKGIQVLGEAATVPVVLSLFITNTVREIVTSDAPEVKWWIYLALGVASLVRDWRRNQME